MGPGRPHPIFRTSILFLDLSRSVRAVPALRHGPRVEEKWAGAFEDVYQEPPDWYVGRRANAFHTGLFVNHLAAMPSQAGAVTASQPRSTGVPTSVAGEGEGASAAAETGEAAAAASNSHRSRGEDPTGRGAGVPRGIVPGRMRPRREARWKRGAAFPSRVEGRFRGPPGRGSPETRVRNTASLRPANTQRGGSSGR